MTWRNARYGLVVIAALVVVASAVADDAKVGALRTNVPDVATRQSGLWVTTMPHAARTYALNCQGCHGEHGVSVTEMPTLAGRVGYFVRTAEGRKYLTQVPNVALNPASDQDIAELLNWVLMTFSRSELPTDFTPYTAAEVAASRTERIDVAANRQRIVAELVATGQIPSADVLAIPRAVLH